MSLTSALNTAQSLLSNTSTQTSVISKNISNASNANYARRSAEVTSNGWGAEIVRLSRATDDVLFRATLMDTASASGQNTLLKGLDQIRGLLGGNEYERSSSALLGRFQDALQIFASQPGNSSAAQATVADAAVAADAIRSSSQALQKMRGEADAEISRQVGELNNLLGNLRVVNDEIRQATKAGAEVPDALDERGRLLGEISKIIGFTTVTRSDNDIALYTTNGTVLFETVPRAVTFAATSSFDASVTGNAVLIDGVPLSAGNGGATSARGSLAGLLQMRDRVAPEFQSQLDETARALVTIFAESDSTGVGPDLPGLFTWDGGSVPASGTIEPGMALSLRINPAFAGSATNARLLRDGGANGPGYVVNTANASGFSELLDGYLVAMGSPMDFDAAAGIDTRTDLMSFTADSAGWLETLRQEADGAAEAKNAAYYRSTEALSNSSGVNLDEEMAKLIELEQSFKASSKLIATVDEMLDTILAAFR